MQRDHEGGALGVQDRQDRRHDRPGAQGQERGAEAEQFVAGPDDEAAGVAGGQDHDLRCPVQAFEVVDGERAVGQAQGGEQRVARVDAAVRCDVGQGGAVQVGQHRLRAGGVVDQGRHRVDRGDPLRLPAGSRQSWAGGHHDPAGFGTGAARLGAGVPEGG